MQNVKWHPRHEGSRRQPCAWKTRLVGAGGGAGLLKSAGRAISHHHQRVAAHILRHSNAVIHIHGVKPAGAG